MAEILVVDDEIGIRELLSEILGDEGHSVLAADCAAAARRLRDENPVDLVLLDIWMPDTDGVTLLKEWASTGKLTMPVIMMSGHATIDTAVEATRIGALDFLEKPIALQKLLKAVEQGLARKRQQQAAAARAATGAAAMPEGAVAGFVPVGAPAGLGAAYGLPNGAAGAGAPVGLGTGLAAGGLHGAGLAGGGLHGTVGYGGYGGGGIGAHGAAIALRELPLELPLREARDAFERAYFEYHLSREHGSMTRVAEKTGLERTHLYRKLKQLGIDLSKGAWRKGVGQ